MPREDVAAVTEVVRGMSPEQLRRALAAAPHVGAAARGRGPLAGYFQRSTSAITRDRLAAHLAHVACRRLTVQQLDPASLQLLSIVLLLGGRITDEQLAAETDALTPEERRRMIDGLIDRVLLRAVDGGFELVDHLEGIIGHHGRSVRSLMLDPSTTKEDFGQILLAHRVDRVPPGKQDRLDLLAAVLADPDHIGALRELLREGMPEASAILDELVDAGAAGVPASTVGIDPWYVDVYQRLPVRQLPPAMDALRVLDHFGLVWVNARDGRIGVWTETIRAVHGRLARGWTVPIDVDLVPLRTTEGELPSVLSSFHGLLDRVATEPITGLKSGAVGVRSIRELAKRLGRPEQEVDLLFGLAYGVGAIRSHEVLTGKGRNAAWTISYVVDPAKVTELRSVGSAALWRTLVDAWTAAMDSEDRHHHVAMRFQALHDLTALEPGAGVPSERWHDWLASRHWLATNVDPGLMLTELRILGLAPADGPVGLTTLGRLLLTDPGRLEELIPAAVRTFVVQADQTVVAPPTLHPEVRSALEQLATMESSGSATVYRLSPAKIGAHLADGHSASSVLEFLTSASTVPVPPTVSRLVEDVERQRGGLTVRSAHTIVTADDVMALATAVSVKAARLTLLAPSVAVSELPPAKVIAALRAKGLAPSTEDGRVAIAPRLTDRDRPGEPPADAVRPASVARANGSAGPHEEPLLLGDAEIDELVAEVVGGDGRPPRTRTSRTSPTSPTGHRRARGRE